MATLLTEELAAASLGALGNPTRLRLYRLLVRAGQPGLPVGTLIRTLGTPASTLAHHLACLTRAGLVEQEQRGREVRSRPDFGAMTRLMTFLTAECCTGAPSAQSTEENDCVPTATCPERDEP
ncbi:MAG: helix-turn-helix transcriptional regulator [Acidobacteria bacterium]|nr:helix-turn-helix transcriptional regulator [Acidobacteriota bacterium]MYG76120.1 helix-turn-helix transcriptional regulator [Acidobacteriota bacterium]